MNKQEDPIKQQFINWYNSWNAEKIATVDGIDRYSQVYQLYCAYRAGSFHYRGKYEEVMHYVHEMMDFAKDGNSLIMKTIIRYIYGIEDPKYKKQFITKDIIKLLKKVGVLKK